MLADELKKIFQNKKTNKKTSFEKCQIGYIFERENKFILKRLTRKGWHFKSKRPAKVVFVSNDTEEVFFMLFSTSKSEFICQTDIELKIEGETPRVDLTECSLNEECSWFKSGKVSKPLKFHTRRPCYVLRTPKHIFESLFTSCGKCSENLFPLLLRKIVEYELKKYKRRNKR